MKQVLFALLHHAGILRFFAWLNRSHPTILSYHSVLESETPLTNDPHKQHIPLPLFQKHLDYLSRHYNVVTLAQFIAATREGRRLPDYSVVLTFEDGFRDFHTVAAPQLEQRQLRATVFVITDFAGETLREKGGQYLSWQEIRDLSERGFYIGSHTCTHPNLTELSTKEVSNQLAHSLAAIRRHVDQNLIALSYPYGFTSQDITNLARNAGYMCAIGNLFVDAISDDNRLFALSGVTIASDDRVPALAARVSGFASWARRVFRNDSERTFEPYSEPLLDSSVSESEPCPDPQVISS